MFKTQIICLGISTLLLLTGSATKAQELPDSLRAQVKLKVVGDSMLIEQIQQLFLLHFISAGAQPDQETPEWILDIQVIQTESTPEWVALSMVVS